MNLKEQLQNLAQKFAVGGTTESGPGFGKKIVRKYQDDADKEIVEFEDGTRMYTESPEYRKLYSEGLLYGESPEKITYPQETGANSEMDRFKRIELENPYSDFVKPYFDGTSGVLARGFGQSEQNLANTPDDLKQRYDQDINKKWAQEIFQENPRNENEERGAYLNRVGSGLKPEILKNLYDYMPEREMETYWQLGEKGVAALTDLKGMPGLENFSNLEDYIQGSNHMSDYEKSKYFSDLKENPNSTRLGTAVGTLAPLGILAETVVAGARDDYSVEDAGRGIQNNTSPWVKAAVDPLNIGGIGLFSKLGSVSKFSKGLSTINKFGKESELLNTTKKLDLSHFANEDEFYRVIVGDNAYNDILESGLIRTKRPNDFQNATNGINLDRRGTTGYPSFSKGKVSTEYAQNNPEHYIISSKDPSLQPSTSGRHGKGSTMFPTDSNGKHLESLSADKTNIYKHVGDGNYEPVSNFKNEINWGEWNVEIGLKDQLNSLSQKYQVGGQTPSTQEDWKQKYSTNPYFKDREDWGDKLQNKFPNAKNTVKESIYAASKRTGIDPGLLYTSAMEEGMKLALSGKDTGVRREGFVDYQKNNPKAKEYPIDGGYYYGLNTFGDKYGKTIKVSNLPKGFKYTPYPQKGTDGSVAFNSAAFRTHEDAISAKAAQMKQVEEAMNYKLRDAKIDLSPEARKFFDMVGYNMGEEKTIEMIKSYQQKGYLKDDRFLDSKFQPASWKEPYTNVQRRYQNYRILNEQGYFKDYDTPNPKVAVTGSTKEPNSFQVGGKLDQTKEWWTRYINSPKYKERLQKEFPKYSESEIDSELSARKLNLDRTYPIVGGVGEDFKNPAVEGYAPLIEEDQRENSSIKGKLKNFIEDNIAPSLRPVYLRNGEDSNTYTHEISHSVDEGGRRIPIGTVSNIVRRTRGVKPIEILDKTDKGIFYNNVTNEDTKKVLKNNNNFYNIDDDFNMEHSQIYPDISWKIGGDPKTYAPMFGYNSNPTEMLSKLQSLRKFMYDKGVHDSATEDISKEKLNNYINSLYDSENDIPEEVLRVLDELKTEDYDKSIYEKPSIIDHLQWMLNNIAMKKNSNSENVKYAQKGGIIRSELQKLSEKLQRPSTT